MRGAYSGRWLKIRVPVELSPRAWGVLSDNCMNAVPTVDPTIADCRSPSASAVRWGAQKQAEDLDNVVRLIPAHAGSTTSPTAQTRGLTAHPRSRGEHMAVPALARARTGSSPLTRGARALLILEDAGLGLIPAHAGSTDPRTPGPQPWPAHPRSRGEHDDSVRRQAMAEGSSPLTRGALRHRGERL